MKLQVFCHLTCLLERKELPRCTMLTLTTTGEQNICVERLKYVKNLVSVLILGISDTCNQRVIVLNMQATNGPKSQSGTSRGALIFCPTAILILHASTQNTSIESQSKISIKNSLGVHMRSRLKPW